MCEKSFCEGENWYVLWDESRLEFEDKSISKVKSGGYNNGNLMKCGNVKYPNFLYYNQLNKVFCESNLILSSKQFLLQINFKWPLWF